MSNLSCTITYNSIPFHKFSGSRIVTDLGVTFQFVFKVLYSIVTIQKTATTITGRNVKDLSLENVYLIMFGLIISVSLYQK